MVTLKKLLPATALPLLSVASLAANAASDLTYPVVDTHASTCVNTTETVATCPAPGSTAFGQDAQYRGFQPAYSVNNNGTVTDQVTGLMWAQTIDLNQDGEINVKDKLTYDQAAKFARQSTLAGFDDWRVPTIKELYSLILFDGQDPSGMDNQPGELSVVPFIDNRVFGFNSGDMQAGERLIDAQYLTSTKYVSTTMNNAQETVFGVNFIDGRIKGYGLGNPSGEKTFYVLLVRGENYGDNNFVDNGDRTITDTATGLTWQQTDSIKTMDWPSALNYCESLTFAGHSDWRLPNVKELQSIVDYSRSPETSNSAAIAPLFITTQITNEAPQLDYANYWSSTTHLNPRNAANGAYVAFGRSLGFMNNQWSDVHGAGSQRSDPKVDDGNDYTNGHGPQGDAIRINNMVRCVTDEYTEFVQQPKAEPRSAVSFTITASQEQQAPVQRPEQEQAQRQGQGQNQVQGQRSAGNPMERLDTNKDGKISKDEARGPIIQAFNQLDTDGDGFISSEELKQSRNANAARKK